MGTFNVRDASFLDKYTLPSLSRIMKLFLCLFVQTACFFRREFSNLRLAASCFWDSVGWSVGKFCQCTFLVLQYSRYARCASCSVLKQQPRYFILPFSRVIAHHFPWVLLKNVPRKLGLLQLFSERVTYLKFAILLSSLSSFLWSISNPCFLGRTR